jgi:[ribosomal protein S18]-alanine N-acetyltransferase
MRLRPATKADVPAIMAIQRETPTLSQWSRQQYENIFTAGSSRSAAVVEDDHLCGFVVVRDLGTEWEVENIAVASPYRRRGAATVLLDHAVNLARIRGARVLFLEVRQSNQPARRLYEKHHFAVAGRRHAYYLDPVEDAIVYKRLL